MAPTWHAKRFEITRFQTTSLTQIGLFLFLHKVSQLPWINLSLNVSSPCVKHDVTSNFLSLLHSRVQSKVLRNLTQNIIVNPTFPPMKSEEPLNLQPLPKAWGRDCPLVRAHPPAGFEILASHDKRWHPPNSNALSRSSSGTLLQSLEFPFPSLLNIYTYSTSQSNKLNPNVRTIEVGTSKEWKVQNFKVVKPKPTTSFHSMSD